MMDEPQFRTVLRGYDQEQVAAVVKDLQNSLGVARRAVADRTMELSRVLAAKTALEAELAEVQARPSAPDHGSPPAEGVAATGPTGPVDAAEAVQPAGPAEPAHSAAPGPPSRGFDELGTRVASILSLAEAEADQLRTTAAEEARTIRQEAAAAAEALRIESEQYAGRVHERADSDVVRMTSAATATADAIVAQANEHAQAQRAEADRVLEEHRSRAAGSTAELDASLAERRQVALSALAAERAEHEAWVADARSGAEQVVAAAYEQAAQVRLTTRQELEDTIRRRDAVHAHLAEVNQLLAVLEEALVDAGRLPDPEPTSHG